ncbi:hypothetical protein, partial [Cyclobacterium amurskyense]|uniref:hypothetical protein n=1 Tax=Cyclobacterium amurskyense TaxID=320787 RepID=UPI0030D85CAF
LQNQPLRCCFQFHHSGAMSKSLNSRISFDCNTSRKHGTGFTPDIVRAEKSYYIIRVKGFLDNFSMKSKD